VATDNQVRGDGHLIDKCEKYNVANTCNQCVDGYILTLDSKKCVSKTSSAGLNKCILVENDGTTCNKCDKVDGYGLVNGSCNLSLIDGCLNYNWTTNHASAVQCEGCKDTYYKNANTCKKGKIPNCLQYNDAENRCSKCLDGFWLLADINTDDSSYCFPKDTATGCKVASFTVENDLSAGDTNSYLQMTCDNCDSAYGYVMATEDTDVKPKCQQLTYTGNCQAVQSKFVLNFADYSFPCTKCSDDQYLSADDLNYVCKTRLKSDPESANCLTFNLSSE